MADIWAHRGASSRKRENTIDAFTEAKALAADGVELDVRRSRDRAMVVHHDAALVDGRLIHDLDASDLPAEVPLLDAALAACEGMVVNIEIKNVDVDPDYDPTHHLAGAVVALVTALDLRDRVVVSCFGLDTLDRVRELDDRVPCGYLTSPRWDQSGALQRAIEHGHAAFHPHHLVVSPELVAAAHDAGLSVNTWTVDDPERMRWLVDVCGVDAVITNVPDLARQTLG
jgi:glycerophosphoryl diester phosphodiesterase